MRDELIVVPNRTVKALARRRDIAYGKAISALGEAMKLQYQLGIAVGRREAAIKARVAR